IGEALIAGLVAGGIDPKNIIVANRSEDRLSELADRYGVLTADDSVTAAVEADVLVNSVKTNGMLTVFDGVAAQLDDNDASTVAVAVAAGVTIGAMENVLPGGTPVVRVMPNTPMLVGKGTSAIAGGRFATKEQLETVRELLSKVGTAVVVKEKDIDAVKIGRAHV